MRSDSHSAGRFSSQNLNVLCCTVMLLWLAVSCVVTWMRLNASTISPFELRRPQSSIHCAWPKSFSLTGNESEYGGDLALDEIGRSRFRPKFVNLYHPTHEEASACFLNQTLIMVGDSLTRYTVQHLINFLETGKQLPPFIEKSESAASIVWEYAFANPQSGPKEEQWHRFYNASNYAFTTNGGVTLCDCHRHYEHRHLNSVVENRFYRMSGSNRPWNVIYITKFGLAMPTFGHFGFPPFDNLPRRCHLLDNNCIFSHDWGYLLNELFEKILVRIPSVSDIMLNVGVWTPLILQTEETIKKHILEPVRRIQQTHPGIRFWWRRTYQSMRHDLTHADDTILRLLRTLRTHHQNQNQSQKQNHNLNQTLIDKHNGNAAVSKATNPHSNPDFVGIFDAFRLTNLSISTFNNFSIPDGLHFQPWVYEEINYYWMNVYCGRKWINMSSMRSKFCSSSINAQDNINTNY